MTLKIKIKRNKKGEKKYTLIDKGREIFSCWGLEAFLQGLREII